MSSSFAVVLIAVLLMGSLVLRRYSGRRVVWVRLALSLAALIVALWSLWSTVQDHRQWPGESAAGGRSEESSMPEVWLRGPLPDVPPLVQPVAHALLQAQEEVHELVERFPPDLLWARPAGVAAPGFHLQHLSGVLDRLFTYARAESLTPSQLADLAAERSPGNPAPTADELVRRFDLQVEEVLGQLRATDEQTLTEYRGVGQQQLPSTVLGLLVHAAEHTQRHVG